MTKAERECRDAGVHLNLVRIPHNEICEMPWDAAHQVALDGVDDIRCLHCDSDWLDGPDDFSDLSEEQWW
jgi:hypothetical protein